jgi:hypothetical protein
MPEPGATAEQQQCRHCRCGIVHTDVGWTHVDRSGHLAGWICPLPHMTLAEPQEESTRQTRHPKRPQHVSSALRSASQRAGEPSRRPTAITPRKSDRTGPPDWPPPPGDKPWWENP